MQIESKEEILHGESSGTQEKIAEKACGHFNTGSAQS